MISKARCVSSFWFNTALLGGRFFSWAFPTIKTSYTFRSLRFFNQRQEGPLPTTKIRKDGDAWGGFPESVGSPHGYNWLCKSMFWIIMDASPGFSSKEQKLRIKLKSEGKDHKQVPKWPILNFQLRTFSVGFLPRVFMCTCQQPDVHHVPRGPKKDKTSKKIK